LQHLGLSVVGDETYNGRAKALRVARNQKRFDLADRIAQLNGFALHAWRLAFDHPRTKERLQVEAPVPEDMATLLALLSETP
jgi:23S rRNA pseudouridine1911/1915/1917 synthase